MITTLVGCDLKTRDRTVGPFIKYQEVEGVKVPHFFYKVWNPETNDFYKMQDPKTGVFYDASTVPIPCTKATGRNAKFMCAYETI